MRRLMLSVAMAVVLLGSACSSGKSDGAAPAQPAAGDRVRTIVLVEDVRPDTAASVKVGDAVRIRDTKGVLGTVEAIEATAAMEYVETGEGAVVYAVVPEVTDLRISVVGDAVTTESGIRFGNEPVYVNDELKLITPLTYLRGTVVLLEPLD